MKSHPFLCHIMLLSILFLCVSPTLSAQFAGGSGTITDPYQVSSPDQLFSVRDYLGSHYIQTADIDLGVDPFNLLEGWEPIGVFISTGNPANVAFTGTFNGNGYEISNLYINRPDANGQGLFGYVSAAHLISVCLTNATVNGNSYSGGLAGYAKDQAYFSGCKMQGIITAGGQYIGGLVGYSDWLVTINKCKAVTVVAGNNSVGGLIGTLGPSCYANECQSEGNVIGINNRSGGITGLMSQGSLIDSFSRSHVSGVNNVGGLVGYAEDSALSKCFSTGNVTGTTNVGGLIGSVAMGGNYNDCYWDTEASGIAVSAGGQGRITAQMTYPFAENTYVNWDFINTWGMDVTGDINNGYPFLVNNIPVSATDPVLAPAPQINLTNHPNPVKSSTDICVNIAKSAPLSLLVYNLRGQLVKQIFTGTSMTGMQTFRWDGKDSNGRTCPTGVYLLQAITPTGNITVKMMVLK